ncbi:MAG: sugar kinase [Bacteroidetes bacterium]|nr:sugar kinase [Bacteroidota bacterium]
MSLLVVGTVAFDAIETPFGKTDKIVGGAATYISLAASFFTKHIFLVSVIGDDFPQETLEFFRKKNINLDGLEIVKGGKSFFWAGRYRYDLNSRETLATELNVLADFVPRLPSPARAPDFVMLGNLTPAVQMEVIRQLIRRPRIIAIDTMNYWMNNALEELLIVIRSVDLLIINDEEARQLSGENSLRKGARKILAMGPQYIVIKKGEHGALLFNKRGEVFFAPALPLEDVVDPTGAGDSFAGGMMGYLDKTRSVNFENLKRAVICGSATASFCVEKFGTQRLEEVKNFEAKERIQNFPKLTRYTMS